MSTLGRIFVVLNLILAAVFVGFASTYLQQASDYRGKFNKEVADRAEEVADWKARLDAAGGRETTLNARVSQLEIESQRTDTRNKELVDENERLDKQLSQIDAAMQSAKSSLSTITAELQRTTTQSDNALKQALAAQAEKDGAVQARSVAQADLADAKNRIKELEETVTARDASLVASNDTIAEQKIVIDNANRMWPGMNVPALAMPSLKGTVSHVAGNLVTVVVTENPASAEIKPGYRFAIADSGSYKGEAFVREVEGNTAFCTMTIVKDGSPAVSIGDAAMTHTY